jgi:hypothetical protein
VRLAGTIGYAISDGGLISLVYIARNDLDCIIPAVAVAMRSDASSHAAQVT